MADPSENPAPARPARRPLLITLTAVAAVTLYYLLPPTIDELQRRTLAIFLVAAVFWASEVLPLFATSLLLIGFMILFLAAEGGLAMTLPPVSAMPEARLHYDDFLSPFGSPIIVLFLGGFLLSAAMTRHGLDRKIAAIVLRPFNRSPLLLLVGVLLITAFFSLWISNTATTAMMLAIVAPILRGLPGDERFARGLVLAVPFGANIGGIGTPIGSPPNAVAFGLINDAGLGVRLSFLDWMILAVPLQVAMLAVVTAVLYLRYRPGGGFSLPPLPAAERVRPAGWACLAVLVAAILLWLTGELTGLTSAGVALLVAAALTAFGLLDRHDVKRLDWDVLILLWGGLSLGAAITLTGTDQLVQRLDFAALPGGTVAVLSLLVLLAVGMSTLMSNTASANLLVPLVLALGLAGNAARVEAALLVALACSLAMALPVSTPPNAMAFATGRISSRAMLTAGGTISILGMLVLLLAHRPFLDLVLPRL